MTNQTAKKFIHDCDRCIFLGPFENRSGNHIDLHYCPDPRRPSLSSLIGRYGDECSHYASSMPPEAFADGYKAKEWEKEVVKRAIEAGVYIQPKKEGASK